MANLWLDRWCQSGSVIWKVVPRSGFDLIVALLPCVCVIACMIDSPSLVFGVTFGGRWVKKCCQILFRFPAEIPGPLSRTAVSMLVGRCSAVIITLGFVIG